MSRNEFNISIQGSGIAMSSERALLVDLRPLNSLSRGLSGK